MSSDEQQADILLVSEVSAQKSIQYTHTHTHTHQISS